MANQPADLDLEQLAAAIEQHVSSVGPVRPLTVLGAGFRSLAVATGGGFVVKVGRSSEATEDFARELRTAPILSRHIGTPVPQTTAFVSPCPEFTYGAISYRRLPGETPAWGSDVGAAFASELGAFMAQLHRIPVSEARAEGLPEVDSYDRVLGARDVVMPVLEARLEVSSFARLRGWWESFESDSRMRTGRNAVCHHDLWHGNLLRSEAGRLSGVLDIAHVEISDPAHDFSAPRYFGNARFEELLNGYARTGGDFDADDRYRAMRFFEGREFGGLAWAIEHEDAEETAAAIEKVRRGPIFD